MNIPANSVVVVQVADAQSTYSLNAGDVMNAVSAELDARGYIVLTSSQSGGDLSLVTPLITEKFQGTFNIEPQGDTDSNTLAAAVAQAFEDVTGYAVYQVTIPTINGASTGQPVATPTGTQSLASGLKGIFSGLSGTAIVLIVAAVALLLLVIALKL